MELTGIDKTNQSYFEPLLFLDGADPGEIQILAGVIHGGSPVAAAALGVDLARKTGRIVSIYTRPDMRRQKAGTMLMKSLEILSRQYKLDRMECFFTEKMKGLDPFLRAYGFMTGRKKSSESCRMSDLLSNKRIRFMMNEKQSIRVRDFGAIERQQINVLNNMLAEDGYSPIGQDFDKELSLVAFLEGEPSAVILCSADHSGKPEVVVRLLASFAKSPIVIPELLAAWLNVMTAAYGTDATIRFYSVNPGISSFVRSLAALEQGQYVWYGEKSIV